MNSIIPRHQSPKVRRMLGLVIVQMIIAMTVLREILRIMMKTETQVTVKIMIFLKMTVSQKHQILEYVSLISESG